MSSLASERNKVTCGGLSRISLGRHRFGFAVIASISTSLLVAIESNAQQWVPRNPSPTATIAPIAQPVSATHLVIQPPQPLKHHGAGHHGMPQVELPTQHETVGGGYWNQTADPRELIVNQDGVMFDDQFEGAELPPPAPPKKKIDLTHAFPSHAHKTPRSTAIPQASRTTGWKQPYSYGHFGAKHNRQWSVHHGHQRSHTQWTFR
jgi:hypothetical protein